MKLVTDEFEMKKEIMDRRETKRKILRKKIENKVAPEATVSQELMTWGGEPQRVLSEEVADQEGWFSQELLELQ